MIKELLFWFKAVGLMILVAPLVILVGALVGAWTVITKLKFYDR